MLQLRQFPDATILLPPVIGAAVRQLAQHARGGDIQHVSRLDKMLGCHQHVAIHTELQLVAGIIADPHRLRVLIAAQRRITLGGDFITIQGIAGAQPDAMAHDSLRQPGKGRLTIFQRPEIDEGFNNQAGIAHPGVAVIIIFLAADPLRQGGGGSSSQRAGRGVPEKLQRQGRTLHQRRVAALITQALHPAGPASVAGFNPLIDSFQRRHRQRLFLGNQQRAERAGTGSGAQRGADLLVIQLCDLNIFAGAQHRHDLRDVKHLAFLIIGHPRGTGFGGGAEAQGDR